MTKRKRCVTINFACMKKKDVYFGQKRGIALENVKENKMGVMPVNKLLVTMSLPMIVSMLVSALYNVVDSIFVAQISENALTAVSLAFPIQNLMIAVATGTGVGVNSLVAKSLGEKNKKNADMYASNGVFLAILSYALFLIIGLTCSKWFFEVQTDIPEILEAGYVYMFICCVLSFGVFGQIVFERLVQATGKTIYSMITQGVGAIINIILDPILIFGYFGLPKMGVAGAAFATVIGQIIACILGIIINEKKNKEIKVDLIKNKPNLHAIEHIYAIGLPSIIMASIGSVMSFIINKILIAFTATAAAVFGVYFKLQSFVFMPVFGLNNGLVPIFSYNYGAQNRTRMMKSLKLATLYSVILMFLGFLGMQFFAKELLLMFKASSSMLQIGIPALRIISLSFVFAGFCITVGSAFQSLGHGFMSMLVSIARQLIVLVPVAYLLSLTGRLELVWWAFPIAEVASLALTIFFFIRLYEKIIKNIPLKQE